MNRGEGGGQQTVLVVEDEGEIRSAWRRYLRAHGYRVITSEDDEEAMERVECEACQMPGLILTDLELPTLENLVRRAGENERLRGVPVVTIDPECIDLQHKGVRVLKDYDELRKLIGTL